MVDAEDIFYVFFGYSQSKLVLAVILCLIVATYYLLRQNRSEISNWKGYLAILLIGIVVLLVWFNFFRSSELPTEFTPKDHWSGNESVSIDQKDSDRLDYIQSHFVIVKRSWIDTPSRFDYSDDGTEDYLDRAGEYYKTNYVKPEWDVHIYIYNNTRIFRVLLFFPTQRNTKHALDFEYFELYFRIENENLSTYNMPDYISFPTYAKFTQHPRVFLTWGEVPNLHGNTKALVLDPDTNSFAENYWAYPTPNRNNLKLTFISPNFFEAFDYMTETEKYQVYIFYSLAICLILFYIYKSPSGTYRWYYLIFICVLFGTLPFISLSYDYVTNPSFRVWYDSSPSDDAFYQSDDGYTYISQYDTPWHRSSWNKPDNKEICQ